MKVLNAIDPLLPPWPQVSQDDEGGPYVVRVKYVGFIRYHWVQIAGSLLMLLAGFPAIGFFTLGTLLGDLYSQAFYFYGALVLIIACILVYSNPKLITFALFPKTAEVVFSREYVRINGTEYQTPAGMEVQFRAHFHPLKDEQYEALQKSRRIDKDPSAAIFMLKFRRVEMIYGLNVIEVATLADAARAEQFALVLQYVFDLSRQARSTSARGPFSNAPTPSVGGRPPE